jgi:hypothetical protein
MRRVLALAVASSLGLLAVAPAVVLLRGGSHGVAVFSAVVASIAALITVAARKLRLPMEITLLLLLPFALGWGLGEPLSLFSRVAQFDKVCHVTGGLCLGVLAAGWVVAQGPMRHRGVAMLLAALGLAALLGSLWEIGEVVFDLILKAHSSGTSFDTAGDLTADLLGGALGAAAVALAPRVLREPGRLARPLRRLSLAKNS